MNDRQHLALIHRCDCVVCLHCKGIRVPCVEAHHVEAYRGEHSAYATCPLCKDCHDLLHRMHRKAFYLLHNIDDIKLLAWTAMEIIRLLA